MCPIQIHIADNREDIVLLETIFSIIGLNYELTTSDNISDLSQINNIMPDIIFIGSAVIHHEGDRKLCEIKNDSRFIDIPVIILVQSELCEKYLISRTLPKTQVIIRPFEFTEYQELIKQILYREIFN